MATRTIALTVLATEYAHQLVSQINRTAVALRLLPIVVGAGANCSWVAKGSGATAAAMAEGASAGTPSNDEQVPATLNWGYYKSDGGATGPAQATAQNVSSPAGNHSVLANDVVDSLAAIASQLNQHIYTGNGAASPKQLTGLDAAIGDATNTYGTIDRTSKTWFQPNVFNPGVATQVTHAMLRSDIGRIKAASGEAPNLALCDTDVFNAICGTFDSNRRFNQPVDFVDTRRGKVTLDASVGAVMINGCLFVEDKDAPLESGNASGKIYYLNTNYVELVVLPQPEIAPLLQQAGIVAGQVLQANDGFGEIPLLAAVVAMAKTSDADTFMSKVYAELRVRKPASCGVRRFAAVST